MDTFSALIPHRSPVNAADLNRSLHTPGEPAELGDTSGSHTVARDNMRDADTGEQWQWR